MSTEKLFDTDSSDALFSPCRTYRYLLTRRWADPGDGDMLAWIMLNPSTADEDGDDPTIRRCIGYARRWGYQGITVANIFALRSTDPTALKNHPDPVGPDNDEILGRLQSWSPLVMAAWGANPLATIRARDLIASRALRTTRLGSRRHRRRSPRHPLYVRGDAFPTPWPLGGAA